MKNATTNDPLMLIDTTGCRSRSNDKVRYINATQKRGSSNRNRVREGRRKEQANVCVKNTPRYTKTLTVPRCNSQMNLVGEIAVAELTDNITIVRTARFEKLMTCR